MQKIIPALARLNQALDRLHESHGSADRAQAQLDAWEVQCAHLRSDISALKKQKQDLELRQTKAAQQVEKAMAQIDQVLGAE